MNISEAAAEIGLTTDTIRYYEKIGLLPPITRNQSGIRDFQKQDLEALAFVKCFRSAGISVERLRTYMSLYAQGRESRQARLEILQEEREQMSQRLEELKEALDKLDGKIAAYDKGEY